MEKTLKKGVEPSKKNKVDSMTADLVEELMNASTSFHKLHLQVEGVGSFAAHKALNEIYEALPGLAGKLTSNAIRVPVPNGSLVVLNLEVGKKTTITAVNNIMKKYALEGELVEQIKYSLNNELVSSDIVGTSAPSIYDFLY